MKKYFVVERYNGKSMRIPKFENAVNLARIHAEVIAETKGLLSHEYHVDVVDQDESIIVRIDALRLRVWNQREL